MRQYYIIAGNIEEAITWARNSGPKLLNHKELYVSEPCQIQHENPDGVFIGTWKERKDIDDIFIELFKKTSYDNSKYAIIKNTWDELNTHRKSKYTSEVIHTVSNGISHVLLTRQSGVLT